MNALDKLTEFRSWKLDRLSPATYHQDITVKLKYLTPKDAEAIRKLLRGACCYRCRIGLGPYSFGSTAEEAIDGAVKLAKEKRRKERK